MKNIEPCKVCGSTDANLIDGYYYCVECGTQDVNVRETVVEEMQLADGTISYKQRKKIYKAAEDDDNLSDEWYKWHAFNFILVGLADEMIAIGAKPTFKKKLLWLWTEYMKKFQNKKELGLNKEGDGKENRNDENDGTDNEDEDGFYDEELFKFKKRPPRGNKELKMITNIDLAQLKKGAFFSLIYIALHLDGNDIHVTDLFRFIKQGKFSLQNCEKFLPPEINIDKVPQWGTFCRSRLYPRDIETYIMSLYKYFQIVPPVPNLNVLVNRYAKELCLPNDFKNLVFSLMHLFPCDHLKIDLKSMKSMGHIPIYECFVMSYFLVAFKMLFGLDDDYELKVSDAVDKINDENCSLKSYNLGNDSEPTDRLFSFREWCNFIQLRKMVLCKNYLYMAEHYQMPIDHYVYMEQRLEVKSRKPTLGEEITMTLLGRIPQEAVVAVIPISEFKASLTPLTSASEVVLQYFNDPDLKLLFSEDFTQYSLKYATQKLYLTDNTENPINLIAGVSETNKIISENIVGSMEPKKYDCGLVYVRNCENKNWLKTIQPSVDHVTNAETNGDKKSDHGYDSNAENVSTVEISSNNTASAIDSTDSPIEESSRAANTSVVEKSNTDVTDNTENNYESKVAIDENDSKSMSFAEISSFNGTSVGTKTPIQEMKRELEKIEEEDYDENIFDDDFGDLVDVKSEPAAEQEQCDYGNQDDQNEHNTDDHHNFPSTSANQNDARSDTSVDDSELFFNESTFDREKTIRELVLATCKKYKIRIPEEYRTKEPKKRKSKLTQDGAGESGSKKQKLDDGTPKRQVTNRGKAKAEINNLLASYYENLRHDVLFQVSEHVKSVVNNVCRTHEEIRNEVPDYENDRDSMDDQIDLNTEDHTDPVPNDSIEIDGSNLEQSSVQLVDDIDNQTQGDPRFDENEYDPKQLYVRIEEETEIEDVYDVADDPDIAAILDKKIEQINKGELPSVSASHTKNVIYEAEDDIPLSVLRAENKTSSQQYNDKNDFPHLLNHKLLGKYNYWTRHYSTPQIRKSRELHERFYIELDKYFPKNFIFVLKECADVIGYSPFRLYKVLMNLERRIIYYTTLN